MTSGTSASSTSDAGAASSGFRGGSIRSWVLAFRPKTLTAAVVPIVVASALVWASIGGLQWWISICALLSSICIQIGTNLVNDAIDFKKGADTETRIGPQRVTQSGLIQSRTVMLGGMIAFGIALALGIPLVVVGGMPIVMIGLISLLCGYAYTGGPFPLAYRGLGDLFVLIFFGIVAVGGTFFLHTGIWSLGALIAGLQIGLLATVLIAINNLRDSPEDVKVGKRTFAVRFGKKMARAEIGLLIFLPFHLGFYWFVFHGWMWAAVLPMLSLPIALALFRDVMRTEPSPLYNEFLARSAKLHLVFGLLLALGMWASV